MNTHTVSVSFDDDQTSLGAIEKALHDAGYTTGDPSRQ
jgi:copper chaperone CopZ